MESIDIIHKQGHNFRSLISPWCYLVICFQLSKFSSLFTAENAWNPYLERFIGIIIKIVPVSGSKKSCYKLTKLLKVTICAFLDDKTWFFQLTPNLKFMREMTCYKTIKQHKTKTSLYINLCGEVNLAVLTWPICSI